MNYSILSMAINGAVLQQVKSKQALVITGDRGFWPGNFAADLFVELRRRQFNENPPKKSERLGHLFSVGLLKMRRPSPELTKGVYGLLNQDSFDQETFWEFALAYVRRNQDPKVAELRERVPRLHVFIATMEGSTVAGAAEALCPNCLAVSNVDRFSHGRLSLETHIHDGEDLEGQAAIRLRSYGLSWKDAAVITSKRLYPELVSAAGVAFSPDEL